MKIAVDFDGVIAKRNGIPRTDEAIRDMEIVKDTRDAIAWLISAGHDVYILTSREEKDWQHIKAFLVSFGIDHLRIGNTKENGTHMILDDRAVRFTNWQDFCKLLG